VWVTMAIDNGLRPLAKVASISSKHSSTLKRLKT
jgi:hypothetical protein